MDMTPFGQVAQAINILSHCTDEEIDHHAEQMGLLLARVGPRLGWSKANSRMLTAQTLLQKLEKLAETTEFLLDWSIVEVVIDAMQKGISSETENPSLAFSSLGRTPSDTERLLHMQCALYHTFACYGSDDHFLRSTRPEEFFKGKIPTYCKKVKAETAVMTRCIGRGARADYLQMSTGAAGLTILAAPFVTSLSLVSWEELRKVPTMIDQYPLVLGAAHDLNGLAFKLNFAYRASLQILTLQNRRMKGQTSSSLNNRLEVLGSSVEYI